jgi:hypothetical protein
LPAVGTLIFLVALTLDVVSVDVLAVTTRDVDELSALLVTVDVEKREGDDVILLVDIATPHD